MTTGQDESGRRGPNLLAGVPGEPAAPGIEAAGLEELRTAILGIREELAALRQDGQAERPEPVTRGELDAWGERLLKRFDEAGVPERAVADDCVLIVAECAARMTDAAVRIEKGAADAEKRLMNRIGELEETLAGKLSAIDTTERTGAIHEQLGSVLSTLGEFRKRADNRFNDIASLASDTLQKVRRLRVKWQALLSPWAIFVFLMGMGFATSIKLAQRLW